MHLVDKHFFPKNYDFFVVNDGVDPRRTGSMLRPGYQHRAQTVSSSESSTINSTSIKATGHSLQGRQDVQGEVPESKVSDSDDHDGDGDDHGSDDPGDECSDDESAGEVENEDEDGNEDSNRLPVATNARSVHDSRLDARVEPEETELANLTSSMSALKFVPQSIRFGRGARSGFAKR